VISGEGRVTAQKPEKSPRSRQGGVGIRGEVSGIQGGWSASEEDVGKVVDGSGCKVKKKVIGSTSEVERAKKRV
jgi:hypothetical protein